MKKAIHSVTCPCGHALYSKCCEPLLNGLEFANSPEQLMRSRYSAYVKHNEEYLLSTWHSKTRPTPPLFSEEPTKWISLTIKHAPPASENLGVVEFVAIYKFSGKAHKLHEISNFSKENNRWVYVDGIFPS